MPSDLYERLHATAIELINSMDFDESGELNIDRIRAVRTPDFKQDYGHVYMTTKARPGHYIGMNTDSLIEHLKAGGPSFHSLEHRFDSVLVDEVKREAAVRWRIFMMPKGVDEVVEYDICWLITMNEDGDKVNTATEFIDGYARDRVREILQDINKGD